MTGTGTEITADDRLQIAETMYRYGEAMDLMGASPVQAGNPDPVLEGAVEVLRTCLTDDAVIRLFLKAAPGPPPWPGPGDAPRPPSRPAARRDTTLQQWDQWLVGHHRGVLITPCAATGGPNPPRSCSPGAMARPASR